MIKLKNVPFLIMGDIHGIGPKFQDKLLQLENVSLLILGDCGLGFEPPRIERAHLNEINRICKRNDIDLYLMAGNHDDPQYFCSLRVEDKITFLPSYSYLKTHCGKTILTVNGGISLDRQARKEGIDYWEAEKVICDLDQVEKADILLTHTGLGSILGYPPDKGFPLAWSKNDPLLLDDLREEQNHMKLIFEKCRPSKWFFGHYHTSRQIHYMDCNVRILDIYEILELK